jgi:hypothetical protein
VRGIIPPNVGGRQHASWMHRTYPRLCRRSAFQRQPSYATAVRLGARSSLPARRVRRSCRGGGDRLSLRPTARSPGERRVAGQSKGAVDEKGGTHAPVRRDDPRGEASQRCPSAQRKCVHTRNATPDPTVDGGLEDRVRGGVARHHGSADDEEENEVAHGDGREVRESAPPNSVLPR